MVLSRSRLPLYLAEVVRRRNFLFDNGAATTELYTLSLHDALPICGRPLPDQGRRQPADAGRRHHGRLRAGLNVGRSEEHTSELQSRFDLVCRLLLEKKRPPALGPYAA